MPRGIRNTGSTMYADEPVEEMSYEDDSGDFERQALEAAESITASFMQMHPPPDGERRQLRRHQAYWQFCPDPHCRVEGHRMRTGWIMVDIGSGGPHAGQQVADYAKLTHAVNLEEALGKPGGWTFDPFGGEVELVWADYDSNFPWGPFTHLFMAKGGVYMMPIEQFCQLGFHRDPRLAPFRQAEIAQLTFYSCDMCPDGAIEYTNAGHLEKHRMTMHKEHVSALANARETAKVIGGMNGTSNDIIARLMQQNEELMRELSAMKQQV